MSMKLKTKIITYVSGVLVTLVLSSACVVFGVMQPIRLEQFMRDTMLKVAVGLIYEISMDVQENDHARFDDLTRRLLALGDVHSLIVYAPDGHVRLTSVAPPPPIAPELLRTIWQSQQPHFETEQVAPQPLESLYYPINAAPTVGGVLKLSFTFASLHAYRRDSLFASLFACVVGLVVLVALVYVLLSNLFRRIRSVIFKMNTIIREQDLTQRVLVQSSDEIGELGEVFNRMADRLLELTKATQRSGLRVTASTEQIVSVAKSQLETAEQFMVSVEQARSGVALFKNLSDQISANAQSVLTNAEFTLHQTIQSVAVVAELVTQMNAVEAINREGIRQIEILIQKAQQITAIVTIIEEITANTKLIAFNATIEAARAGEAGRGFSVVAHEIRSLAASVDVATGNIRKIIRDMQDATTRSAEIENQEQAQVEHGLHGVTRTQEHLDLVLNMLRETVKHARDISAATANQTISTNNLFDTMQKFFQIAQSTKTSSEHTSASARELDRLAEGMQRTVERFKLD